MFDKYFFKKVEDDLIYYEAKNADKAVIMSLYENDQLLDRKEGLIGTFNLKSGKYALEVKNTLTKSTHKFSIEGNRYELEKIKLKELRKLLTQKEIFNEINPTREEIEQTKFKPSVLIFPLILALTGLAIEYFTRNLDTGYGYFAIIPSAIAGWLLYDIVTERVVWLKELRKGRLGFMAIMVVLIGILGELLF